jgi:nucleoside-diphosphate-sugar epimerase
MARIVVTGGAGFLGSHLCRALLDRGDRVVAVDNLVTGSVANIEELFGHRGFTFVEHDVSQYVWVPGTVDAIMHFASPASPIDFERIPIQILKVGGLGTHNCLGLAKAKGAKFFLASTSEVYGDPQVHPQPETYWGHVNPIGPRGVYDEAKRYAEALTMAYHRHHGTDVRIVRIFNSILADEQVLYDDGTELRRESVGVLAARLEGAVDLDGYTVPAFDDRGSIAPRPAIALVGHPTEAPCFEVRTRYGRSVRVTGDHSLFVEGPDESPVARPVTELAIGDRIAIAGRLDVVERDRHAVSMIDVWERAGGDPWRLQLRWGGLGETVWAHRTELLAFAAVHHPGQPDRRSALWPRLLSNRQHDALSLAEVRRLGLAIPSDRATVRQAVAGRACELPALVPVSEELLWLLGLWVAEGHLHRSEHDAYVSLSGDVDLLDRAAKVLQRDLGVGCTRQAGSPARSPALFAHGRLLVSLWEHLGFAGNRKRIPGWILQLPQSRLKWFIEGYREGDGVHSGIKFAERERHEFSTVSEELKDDLVVALARYGICPSIGDYDTAFVKRTGDRRYPFWRITIPAVSPWSPLEWDGGVTQRLDAPRSGDIVWAAIREIVPVESTPLVYDFSVPDHENFWAGTGAMVKNTYGPLMREDDGRAVSNFLVQALRNEPITVFGDGSQTRSFCYVDDEVRGFLALLDADVTGPINIGNANEYTIKELAEMAIEVTGSSSTITYEPLPVDDPTQRQPDLTLARKHLGWEPVIQLREGLTRTAEHFRKLLGDRATSG